MINKTKILLVLFLASFFTFGGAVHAQTFPGGPEIKGSCFYRDELDPELSYCRPLSEDPEMTESGCNLLCFGREDETLCTFYSEKDTCPPEAYGTDPAGTSGSTVSPEEQTKEEKEKAYKPIPLKNPLGIQGDSIPRVVGRAVDKILGVVGALALLVFVYGGVMWLTSAGNEEKVKKGSEAMLYAVVGLFIIFSSYGILRLIIGELIK